MGVTVNNELKRQNEPIPNDTMMGPGHLPATGLLEVAWHRRWLILVSAGLSLMGALLYLHRAPLVFVSTSRIFVEQDGPKIITEGEGVMTQSNNYLYTQAELVKSTPIVASAVDQAHLKTTETLRHVHNPTAHVKRHLSIHVGKKDEIINVAYACEKPEDAAQIANAIVKAYIGYHSARKRRTATDILHILQKEKVKRDAELADKLKTMMAYKQSHTMLTFETREGNIVLNQLAKYSKALADARLQTLKSDSAYASIKAMAADPIGLRELVKAQKTKGVYLSGTSEAASLKKQLDEMELDLVEHQGVFTSDHSAVKSLQEKIHHAKQKIAQLDREFADAQLAVAYQRYRSDQETERQLEQYYQEQRAHAQHLNEQVAQYTLLESSWEQTRQLCDILDSRIKEINVTENVGALNIIVLEQAVPAEGPSEPRRNRVMVAATALGLMAGLGVSLLLGYRDHRLRSAADAKALLRGVPVLGAIPLSRNGHGLGTLAQIVRHHPQSVDAEAYREIRTAVFVNTAANHAKTLLVTSPSLGEGKTVLATNLALAMAQADKKTLLIDANLRQPMIHEVLGLASGPGLSEVLAGTLSENAVIQSTSVEALEAIVAGSDLTHPAEMLNSAAFVALLQKLSKQYDHIVIDAPAILPLADARILGTQCDAALLVLRAGETTREDYLQAYDRLVRVGGTLLGTVVFEPTPHPSRLQHLIKHGCNYTMRKFSCSGG